MWLLWGVEKGDFVCYCFVCIIVLLVGTRLRRVLREAKEPWHGWHMLQENRILNSQKLNARALANHLGQDRPVPVWNVAELQESPEASKLVDQGDEVLRQ